MPKEWIVRVQGREYGPADLDELRAWREDGRLIRENEVREAGSERWFPAAELPEVFADEPAPLSAAPPIVTQMSFADVLSAAAKIYRRGFWRFFALAWLVSAPSFLVQLAFPFLKMPEHGQPATLAVVSSVVAFVALAALVVGVPFSIAGCQLLADDLFAGHEPRLSELLTRAQPLWRRIFTLALVVYGSYLLWTVLPVIVGYGAMADGSLGGIVICLVLLIFAAYMVARLFINFLFWQQSGALGRGDTMEALRESKYLARSGTERPRLQRPLYRGAIIASLWLLAVIILDLIVQLPETIWRIHDLPNLDLVTIQKFATANTFDWISVLTLFASCFVGALLRGVLAAAFVVLYLDTRKTTPPLPPAS